MNIENNFLITVHLIMPYILKPSLQYIALVKIAVTLWNQNDVRALMKKFILYKRKFCGQSETWQKIENKVVEKVQRLPQPEFLKENIVGSVKPVGVQIFKWIVCHCTSHYLFLDLPTEFCWTPQGTIDRKKTAEMLVKDESLDVIVRYNLVCIYCLENDIPEQWKNITENCKELPKIKHSSDNHTVTLWACDMNREIQHFSTMDVERRSYLDLDGFFKFCNKAAIKHFLDKLMPLQRNQCLVNLTKNILVCLSHYTFDREPPKVDYSDILCFLLSQIDENDEKDVFRNSELQTIGFLLEWPWQSLFMEALNRVWNLRNGDEYLILYKILDKINGGYKDFNYKKIFEEIWWKIPNADKKGIQHPYSKLLLSHLLETKDKEIIRLFFQDLSLTEKQDIFLSSFVTEVATSCLYSCEFSSIELLIKACEPSKDLLTEFKSNIQKHISDYSEYILKKYADKISKLLQLLDSYIIEKEKM